MRFGELDGDGFAVEEGEDRVAGVGRFDGFFLRETRIIKTAGVAEAAGFIEDEDVGCSETTVGAGDELLVAVVEVREIPAEAGGVGLHVGERVVVFAVAELVEAEAVGVVGIDGDETETAAAEIVAKFLETFFDAV